jgi:hypothetical protein
MSNQTQLTPEQAKNARAWKKLRPGYNRIWLRAGAVAAIEALRASGEIDNDFCPAVVIGTAAQLELERQAFAAKRRVESHPPADPRTHLPSAIKEAA